MQHWSTAILALATLATTACRTAEPAPRPPPRVPAEVARGVTLTRIVDGLEKPVALTFAPGDSRQRLFVVEKVGRVRTLVDGRLQPATAPFLDLGGRVSTWTEQGLLGLAFHPDFARTRRLYVNLTDVKGDTRVLEFQARADDPDHVDPASERELLFVDQPHLNHNGGDLVFGPDGKLYVGLGDGGSAGDPHGNGQNDRALLAKMLRLDVDEGRASGARPRPVIVAKGLRNPWRYSFDRATGDLWIADVGQDLYEEIDVLPAATLAAVIARDETPPNFGWNVMEGRHCYGARNCTQDGLVLPIFEYGHDDGCSITGGFVYRGRALPTLAGAYFYADYCTAIVRSLRCDVSGAVRDSWEWRPALDPESRLSNISSFGEDADGELYVLSLEGAIYRLDPSSDH
ncbi:MAG: PQQ-dependent sugar dehydrogenase [Deltaproteobacteria bacterium]|nr:PQQ-dependent sugar dehydrogenase [Deltaproteobacteria bacterium]